MTEGARETPVVNSYDEWTRLREVIVGRADGFPGFQVDNSLAMACWGNLRPFLASKRFFVDAKGTFAEPIVKPAARVLKELQEDVEGLAKTLEGQGVKVRRPERLNDTERIQTPFWSSIQSPALNVRDQTIVLGSTIVETAPAIRARIFENDYLKPLFNEYMKNGAGWICMPRPTLCKGALDPSFLRLSPRDRVVLRDHHASSLKRVGFELVIDGAQCIRLGKDVLVNVANKNHELGFQWLQANLGRTFNFHRIDGMSDNHVDSVILPLREGLWLVRNRSYASFLPEKFRRWEFVVAPEAKKERSVAEKGPQFLLSSKYLGMNVLSIDDRTVIVNSLYPELIDALRDRGFRVVPVRHRHGRAFGGGFHCFTLDIRREGGLESYGE